MKNNQYKLLRKFRFREDVLGWQGHEMWEQTLKMYKRFGYEGKEGIIKCNVKNLRNGMRVWCVDIFRKKFSWE